MSRTINLVSSNRQTEVKRILPRFPMCYLTFKESGFPQAFEVVNISTTGMQLLLKDGEIPFKKSSHILGELHWHGHGLMLEGNVVWMTQSRVGVEFSSDNIKEKIESFFSWENVTSHLKPVHDIGYSYDIPALKYWLRADGPHEVFVWQHGNGELESFSVILREQLVRWVDGEGISTGRVISKRRVELPLSQEDEFIFLIDSQCQNELVHDALAFAKTLEEKHLPKIMLDFLKRKLTIS